MMHSDFLARVALVAVGIFLILLALLHFIEPEFDPSRYLISQYELGRYGWVMSIAFFSLGMGVLALVRSIWFSLIQRSGLVGRWWFTVIGISLFGAGIFYPYDPPNLASFIHGICGMIVIGTFPLAATLLNSSLAHRQEWSTAWGQRFWATLLTWIGLLSFMGSIIALGLLLPPTDRSNTNLPIGWQNRFMIVTYCVWLMVIARQVAFAKKR